MKKIKGVPTDVVESGEIRSGAVK